MSGPGSPSGSPAGATGATGAEAERIFAQLLLQGQAQIARETREGLQKLAEGFHEEVQKQWKPWSYKFETWICSQWPTGQPALDYA